MRQRQLNGFLINMQLYVTSRFLVRWRWCCVAGLAATRLFRVGSPCGPHHRLHYVIYDSVDAVHFLPLVLAEGGGAVTRTCPIGEQEDFTPNNGRGSVHDVECPSRTPGALQ